MAGNSGVVVTRAISKPEPVSSGGYDSEYYEGIYYYPTIPHIDLSGALGAVWIFEAVLLAITIIAGGLFIIFMLVSMNKYRCPRCRKPYFLKNEIPEHCTRCGAVLTLSKIQPPK
ncbi:MAG: hypothetical protein NC191_00980 [Muribaculaceae bacterium]|nr:hypothetical protein [Muribaculaceae bacterium]